MSEVILDSRVSAKTAERISLAAAFADRAIPRQNVTVESVLSRIDQDLDLRIRTLKEDPQDAARIPEFEMLQAQFRDIRALHASGKMPRGFELGVVLNNRCLDDVDVKGSYNEFTDKGIRNNLNQKLAKNNPDELFAAGFSIYQISLMMASGEILRPTQNHPDLMPFSWDHLLERANSDRLTTESAVDPLNPDKGESLKINHENNLQLIPEVIHENLKNVLKRIQYRLYSKKDSWFFVSVLPKEYPGNSGLVAVVDQDGPYGVKPAGNNEHIIASLDYIRDRKGDGWQNSAFGKQLMRNIEADLKQRMLKVKRTGEVDLAQLAELKKFAVDNKFGKLYENLEYSSTAEGRKLAGAIKLCDEFIKASGKAAKPAPTNTIPHPATAAKRYIVKVRRPA